MVGHGRSWSVMVGTPLTDPQISMVGHGRSWSVMVGHGRSWSVMVAVSAWYQEEKPSVDVLAAPSILRHYVGH